MCKESGILFAKKQLRCLRWVLHYYFGAAIKRHSWRLASIRSNTWSRTILPKEFESTVAVVIFQRWGWVGRGSVLSLTASEFSSCHCNSFLREDIASVAMQRSLVFAVLFISVLHNWEHDDGVEGENNTHTRDMRRFLAGLSIVFEQIQIE